MKYRDSEGNLQEIYLPPTGDTLPIGSVIEYAGDTVPTNWELVEDTGTYKKIKKVANSVGLVANVTNSYSESIQDSYSCDYINLIEGKDYYSLEEKEIGKWIDNKPLYRKTINIGTITANTQKTGKTGINGLEIMIQSTTTCLYPNGAWHIISPNDAFVYNNGANYSVIDSSNSTKCTMTILYTKTTDEGTSV